MLTLGVLVVVSKERSNVKTPHTIDSSLVATDLEHRAAVHDRENSPPHPQSRGQPTLVALATLPTEVKKKKRKPGMDSTHCLPERK